jgi:hypothetical protein
MAYEFYYAITADPRHPGLKSERVERIQALASQHNLACHLEVHGDTVTLQVETNDSESAAMFKLSAEPALVESFNRNA